MIGITGDTHRTHDIEKLSNKNFNNWFMYNYLIICGDFGFVWDQEQSKEETWWYDWFDKKPYKVLFVDGNHECHDRLDNYPVEEWNSGKIHKISDNVYHLMRGQVFTIEDKKLFTMGGAESVDKMNRTEGLSWWARELPSYAEYEEGMKNLDKHNWKVDYVLTHTCPLKIFHHVVENGKATNDLEKYLDNIDDKLKFKQWFFGHFHQDKSINDGKYKCVYNNIITI